MAKYLNPDNAVANRNVKGNPGKNRKAGASSVMRNDYLNRVSYTTASRQGMFPTPNAGRGKSAQTKVIKSPKIKLPAQKKRNSGGR